MKSIYQSYNPRQAVLDGTADFVVNLSELPNLTENEAREFLDSNVLTSGMEMLLMNAFSCLAGIGSPIGPGASGSDFAVVADARHVRDHCSIWITDPPYADEEKFLLKGLEIEELKESLRITAAACEW